MECICRSFRIFGVRVADCLLFFIYADFPGTSGERILELRAELWKKSATKRLLLAIARRISFQGGRRSIFTL